MIFRASPRSLRDAGISQQRASILHRLLVEPNLLQHDPARRSLLGLFRPQPSVATHLPTTSGTPFSASARGAELVLHPGVLVLGAAQRLPEGLDHLLEAVLTRRRAKRRSRARAPHATVRRPRATRWIGTGGGEAMQSVQFGSDSAPWLFSYFFSGARWQTQSPRNPAFLAQTVHPIETSVLSSFDLRLALPHVTGIPTAGFRKA